MADGAAFGALVVLPSNISVMCTGLGSVDDINKAARGLFGIVGVVLLIAMFSAAHSTRKAYRAVPNFLYPSCLFASMLAWPPSSASAGWSSGLSR
jgi:hypothetical protein